MSGLPSVLEVLRTRRDSRSVPGERDDGFRVALAVEGGGNRAAYSAGMALGLDEAGLTNSFHLTQVRPPLGSPDVSRLSRDADAIRGAIETGRSALHTMLEAPTSVDD